MLDHVEALGYSRDHAEVHGEHVTIGGDMLFERGALLRGEYERFHSPDALIAKGYQAEDIVSELYQGNIKLAFATGKLAPSTEIRDAYIAAAKAWSAIPNSAIRIHAKNTGPSIVIRMIPAKEWKKYPQCKGTDACAAFPLNGRPGKEVLVREKPSREGCTVWSSSALINSSRHELGHALGFTHPEAEDSLLVKDTRWCQYSTEEHCLNDPELYPTIMGMYVTEEGCVVTPARLTQDDYKTCAAVYPAQ